MINIGILKHFSKNRGIRLNLSAAYLKNVLRLTEIDFDNFELYSGRSRSQRMPFYSSLHKEGMLYFYSSGSIKLARNLGYFLEAIRIYNGNSKEGPVPPMHFSVSLDELFNGRIAKDKIKLSVCQKNIDMYSLTFSKT